MNTYNIYYRQYSIYKIVSKTYTTLNLPRTHKKGYKKVFIYLHIISANYRSVGKSSEFLISFVMKIVICNETLFRYLSLWNKKVRSELIAKTTTI